MVDSVKAFFTLIRWSNILMIVLSQYLIRYGILDISMHYLILDHPISLVITRLDFFLLVLSTACIASAGYIINDYFDVRIDQINKPDRVIIVERISRQKAILWHWILTGIGLLSAFWVCYRYDLMSLFFVFIFSSGSLWFYSTTYKHQFLVGNVLIALLAGLVPFISGFMDIILLNQKHTDIFTQYQASINHLAYWVLAFSGFAFMYTLIREIIKDAADIEGDQTVQTKSIPIVLGLKYTKFIVAILYILTLTTLFYLQYTYLKDLISLIYISIGVFFPSCLSLYFILKGNQRTHFLKASLFNKIATLLGILFTLVFYYIIRSIFS